MIPPAAASRVITPVKRYTYAIYVFDYDIASRLFPFEAGDLAAPERES